MHTPIINNLHLDISSINLLNIILNRCHTFVSLHGWVYKFIQKCSNVDEVGEASHWRYSSARDYNGIDGLLEVERFW